MHVFGLTGGIASGKSAVAARLRARGVPVIDADELARDAVAAGSEGLAQVVATFGANMLAANGTLDRKKLASVVFADASKRAALNAIVHPRVFALGAERAAQLSQGGHPLACYEAALIVEGGNADVWRPLVVVAATEAAQVARASVRDGASESDVRARIRAQMPLAEKVKVADYVIKNAGTLEDLERRTDAVLAAICERLHVDPALLQAKRSPADATPASGRR
ncbi:MAG: Dephospho-CoA kinase [Labilithrix sp.]|nr:Dephospho-CoA kinase [Labilithrix sp.]